MFWGHYLLRAKFVSAWAYSGEEGEEEEGEEEQEEGEEEQEEKDLSTFWGSGKRVSPRYIGRVGGCWGCIPCVHVKNPELFPYLPWDAAAVPGEPLCLLPSERTPSSSFKSKSAKMA